MKFNRIIISIFVLVLLIAACTTEGRFRATPTSEPLVTSTPKPGETPTLTPSPTPTHTPAPTAVPIPKGEIVRVFAHTDLCSAPVSYCSPLKVFLEEERVEILSYEGSDWYKAKTTGLTEDSPPIIGCLFKGSIIRLPPPGK
ncbi:MAG: hypothetical protein AAB508_05975 [Patescibacteria group bacterium]